MNFNRVIIAGNLTRDPELRTTQGGTTIAKFGVAINEYAGKDKPKRVTFVNVTAFGSTAEAINTYLKKGDPIHIEGRLDFSEWTDKAGQKRTALGVVVDSFQFVGSKSRDDNSTPADGVPF